MTTPGIGWLENPDYVVTGLFAIVAWFMIRTINKIDKNQTRLFERQDQMEKDFYELRGEHKSWTKRSDTDRRRDTRESS